MQCCGCGREPSSCTANLAIIDQIRPSVILRLPLTISSAPIDTSLTPLLSRNFNALFTLAILCHICSPRSGLLNCSPVTCSSSNKRFRPSLKSSSIVWIWTLHFFKWKLHQAKNVLNRKVVEIMYLLYLIEITSSYFDLLSFPNGIAMGWCLFYFCEIVSESRVNERRAPAWIAFQALIHVQKLNLFSS